MLLFMLALVNNNKEQNMREEVEIEISLFFFLLQSCKDRLIQYLGPFVMILFGVEDIFNIRWHL